jgi:hypothetical protein
VLGAPAIARAGDQGDQGNQNGQGDNGQGNQGGHEGHGDHNAPEPLTVIGLMLGAGGVAVARWRATRKTPAR